MSRLRLIMIVASVLVATPAAAQKADATAAFQRGQQLKRDGRIAEACAAFELSMKLDAQFGTQYNMALCYLALGRTASAWAELDELSHKDSNQVRRADAAKRAHDLEPRLTKVAITLTAPVPGLVITRDGLDVTILVGAPTPVDPGTHRFAARAPGRRDWSAEARVAGEGKLVQIVVPALEPAAVELPPPPPAPIASAAQRPPQPPSIDDSDEHPGRGRRIAGIATFGLGIGGLAIGGVYGYQALSRGDDARRTCGGTLASCTGDSMAAQRLIDDGRRAAKISDVALIAGGVLAATGAVLYLTAPRDTAIAPIAGTIGFAVVCSF